MNYTTLVTPGELTLMRRSEVNLKVCFVPNLISKHPCKRENLNFIGDLSATTFNQKQVLADDDTLSNKFY